MAWRVEYTDTARTQLRRLDRDTARRIINYMDERVRYWTTLGASGKRSQAHWVGHGVIG